MFGEDLPWYAEGISNQSSRALSDKQRRQHDSREVSISTASSSQPSTPPRRIGLRRAAARECSIFSLQIDSPSSQTMPICIQKQHLELTTLVFMLCTCTTKPRPRGLETAILFGAIGQEGSQRVQLSAFPDTRHPVMVRYYLSGGGPVEKRILHVSSTMLVKEHGYLQA